MLATVLIAEDEKKVEGWTPSGVVSLNLSQVSLSNWTQGGQNTISWTLIGDFGAKYISGPYTFTTNLKTSFGRTKLGSDEYQTTDNELFWDQVLEYNFGSPIELYMSNTIRTVVANGFDYSGAIPVQISSFWDPGYLIQALGGAYKHIPGLELRLGFGFKETFADKFFAKYTDDPETIEEEKFKLRTGIDFAAVGKWNLKENIQYKTQLNLFGRFKEIDVWDVRWDNTITAKLSEIFNVNLNVLVIFDKDQSHKTQIKEALQIGISYSIF